MSAPPHSNIPLTNQPPIHQTTYIVQAPTFGDAPVQTVCPSCRQSVVTDVHKVNGTCTWIWCLVICLICFPCFFIPFVTDCAKDSQHTCPSCKTLVGVGKNL